MDFCISRTQTIMKTLTNTLYTQIGYPALSAYANGLFYSPYASTALREYFARGFEAYFLHKDLKTLANISPILYNRIETLADME
jgi:hypothetical protein